MGEALWDEEAEAVLSAELDSYLPQAVESRATSMTRPWVQHQLRLPVRDPLVAQAAKGAGRPVARLVHLRDRAIHAQAGEHPCVNPRAN